VAAKKLAEKERVEAEAAGGKAARTIGRPKAVKAVAHTPPLLGST